MLKIDVDMAWTRFGLEGLIVSRAFRVMVIEIDSNWDKAVDGEWQVMAGPRPWARALQGGGTILVAACTHVKGHGTRSTTARSRPTAVCL